MFSTYRDLFRTPGALAFSSAAFIGRLPMSMIGIGTVLMVSVFYATADGKGNYGLAGQVSAVNVVAWATFAPLIARLVDRHGQARVMRPLVVFSAAATSGLVVTGVNHGPEWSLLVFAALTGMTGGSIGSLVRTRWSHTLAEPGRLHAAYSFESVLDEVIFIIGPVLATALATTINPAAGVVVPIVAALLGGLWFLSQTATEPPPAPKDAPKARGTVLRSPGMVALVLVFVAVGTIFGAMDVATVAFAEEQGSKALAGAVLAAFAAGSMLSGLFYGAHSWVSPLWKRFIVCAVLLGVGVSTFFFATSLPVLAGLMFVVGFGIAPTIINGNAFVSYFVAPRRLTEGLSWIGTSNGLGVALGSWVGGLQIDASGAHAGFLVAVLAGGVVVVATLAFLPVMRRAEHPSLLTLPHP